MKKRGFLTLIFSFALSYLTAFIGSMITIKNVNNEWYDSIKPGLSPPNYVFSIVWTILFTLIALSLFFSLIKSKKNQKNKIVFLFILNLFLNFLWSYLFFGIQRPDIAFIEIFVLWLSIIVLAYKTYKIYKPASYMLIPYLLWVSFAIILNYQVAF